MELDGSSNMKAELWRRAKARVLEYTEKAAKEETQKGSWEEAVRSIDGSKCFTTDLQRDGGADLPCASIPIVLNSHHGLF